MYNDALLLWLWLSILGHIYASTNLIYDSSFCNHIVFVTGLNRFTTMFMLLLPGELLSGTVVSVTAGMAASCPCLPTWPSRPLFTAISDHRGVTSHQNPAINTWRNGFAKIVALAWQARSLYSGIRLRAAHSQQTLRLASASRNLYLEVLLNLHDIQERQVLITNFDHTSYF